MSNEATETPIIPVPRIDCPECNIEVDTTSAQMFSVIKCTHCDVELRVPGLFGEIYLLKEIGRGSTGTVYKGFDHNVQTPVAVKIMHKQLVKSKKHVDTFLGEAKSLKALNHINVVFMHSFGQITDQPYIVMEMIEGYRMEDLMTNKNRMNEVTLLEISVDVTKGMQAANKIGIVHGDIKPENILVDKRGTAKVVDFGLARAFHESDDEVWGTPYFIAPERALNAKEDHRSDIYSLGVTMFDALAGRPPFEGETVAEVVDARIHEAAPDLLSLCSNVTPETAAVVACMLERRPDDRYPDHKSLLADLYGALSAALRSTMMAPS
ncbi:MAG: serine/threonine-protein kinase [Verrucomicrobiota bacterium]